MTQYSLFGYGSMIRDSVRTDAYAKALERAVKPGCVVLDIGTGTGVLALLAARAGARKVIAVEPSDLIQVAQETAEANGLAARIEFHQRLSTTLKPEEQADVVVSDLHGMLPFFGDHIPSIIDARTRLLARDGVLIPALDKLWAAPVESPIRYHERVGLWESQPYGLNLEPARSLATNSWWRAGTEDSPVADPRLLATLDYKRVDSPNVAASANWISRRSGTCSGFSVWFDSTLYDDITFTNAPGQQETIYGQAFFPLERPVEVNDGDSIQIQFGASLVGGDYVYRWATRIARSERIVASFIQSTLHSFPLTTAHLARLDEQHRPMPTEEGAAIAYLLEHADGDQTTHGISEQLYASFPTLFGSLDAAVRFVTEKSLRYCQ